MASCRQHLFASALVLAGLWLGSCDYGRQETVAATMLTIDQPLALQAVIEPDLLARLRTDTKSAVLKVRIAIADLERKPGQEDTVLRIVAGAKPVPPSDLDVRTLGLMSLGGLQRNPSPPFRFQALLELNSDALSLVEDGTGGTPPHLPLQILIEPSSGQRALNVVEAAAQVVMP